MKLCPKCGTRKHLKDFPKNRATKDGLNRICRKCQREYSEKRYARNKKNPQWCKEKRDKSHAVRLKHYFNLTIKKYDEMVELQDGLCAICGKTEPTGRRVAVDHDHKTGDMRGL